ncbi:MAG: hypothetical protein DMG70_06465 [Acidobacteria bacterium]|nr:MAG: hypothetical protein DMG70_06465 [Acidobacteriota bacterium]
MNGTGWKRSESSLCTSLPMSIRRRSSSHLLGALDAVAAEMPVIFRVHSRPQPRLTPEGIRHHPQLRLIPPVGYLDILCLLNRSALVWTDSGGMHKETTALGVPCLTLRENTERPVTISQGTNLPLGTDPGKIVAAARDTLDGKGEVGRIPPIWIGHAANRIVEILLKLVPQGYASWVSVTIREQACQRDLPLWPVFTTLADSDYETCYI